MKKTKTKRMTAMMMAAAMISSMAMPQISFAYRQGESTTDVTEVETKNNEIVEYVATQGMVLLENRALDGQETRSLPLKKGSSVALFGNGAIYPLGNGEDRRGSDNIYEGLLDAGFQITTYHEEDPKKDYLKHYIDEESGYVENSEGIERVITEEQLQAAKADGTCDTAIYVISRTSGEGTDGTATQGDYYLSSAEYMNLKMLSETFENVVVVLNVESPIDTNFFNGNNGAEAGLVQVELGAETKFAADEFAEYRDTEDGLFWKNTENEYVKVEAGEAYDPSKVYYQYFDKYGWGTDYYELSFINLQKNYFIQNSDGSFESLSNEAAYDPEQIYFTENVEAKIENLDALFLMSQAGKRGGHALAKLLSGEVTPSGKLTDTWAVNYMDYPSSAAFGLNDNDSIEEDYTDDIYVGYRYFDTFGVDVAYPFGYGLSYTDFELSDLKTEADHETVSITVTVTNTGDMSGREVVEVYYSAPSPEEGDNLASDLENPYQELAVYAKTDELKPGESQTITLEYMTTDMASYSEENAAYVLQKGDYIIRVGNASRNTTAAGIVRLDESVVTQQLTNRVVIDEEIDLLSRSDSDGTIPNNDEEQLQDIEISEILADKIAEETVYVEYSDGKYFSAELGETVDDGNHQVPVYVTENVTETQYLRGENGTPGEIEYYYQTDVTPGTDVDDNGVVIQGENNPDDDVLVKYSEKIIDVSDEGATSESTLKDVKDGKISMEAFVSTLTLDELSNIVMGKSVGKDSSNEYSVAGEAGETTAAYMEERFITPVSMADGPEGLRLTEDATAVSDGVNYQFCTRLPSATLQAQTWDMDALTMIGDAIGAEMERYGLALWLAPGMNIHRNPLCGRNKEYFSEDPVVTGNSASAVTLGVQAHPGCGVVLKHMAVNNQEASRKEENNSVSERAFREIYLKGFERAVRIAYPASIMTSYNSNNGWAAADDYDMNKAIVRDEWGYDGLIMTDWSGGESNPVYSMHAENDLIMPGGAPNRVSGAWGDGVFPAMNPVMMTILSMNDYMFADKDEEGVVIHSVQADTGRFNTTFSQEVSDLVTEGRYVYIDGCLPGSDERVPLDTLIEEGIVSINEEGRYVAQMGSTVYLNMYVKQGDLAESKTYGNLSIGDIQQCAINVLNCVMNTTAFADYLNERTGTEDYSVLPLNEVFADNFQELYCVEKAPVK